MRPQTQVTTKPAAPPRHRPLLVGVVGLGPRWHGQYAPALRQLADLYQIRGLCDQVHARAEGEARDFQCPPAAGPAEMLADDCLDALLLIDEQWYGLWPAQLAGRARKPVYCALRRVWETPLAGPADQIMIALSARTAPVTSRVQQLLGSMGKARSIVCQCRLRSRTPLLRRQTLSALDWCLSLIPSPPVAVQATASAGDRLMSVLLDFAGGQAVQLTLIRQASPRVDAEIRAERGSIHVSLPARLRWTDASGRHAERLTCRSGAVVRALRQFHHAVLTGEGFGPSLADARSAWRCLEAAQLSLQERRRIDVPNPMPTR